MTEPRFNYSEGKCISHIPEIEGIFGIGNSEFGSAVSLCKILAKELINTRKMLIKKSEELSWLEYPDTTGR